MAAIDKPSEQTDRDPKIWLQLAVVWHGILALTALGGLAWLWTGGDAFALWLRLLVTLILILAAAASSGAALFINRGQHRGRSLSVAVNYLGLIVSVIGVLHLGGSFIGLNGLAENFAAGLPYLVLPFVGYAIVSYSDRQSDLDRQQLFRRIGLIVAGIGLAGFLLAVKIIGALTSFAGQLNDSRLLILALAIIPFALFFWALWRRPAAEALGATNASNEMLSGYLFLSPNLLGFLFFIAGPLLLSLYVSFTDWDAFSEAQWVGLDNYASIFNLDIARLDSADQLANEVLDVTVYDELNRFNLFGTSYVIGAQDKLFWIALGNTLKFVLAAVPLSVIPALLLAVLLNSKIPGMKAFRAIYFLPSVAAVVGIALVWQWLFNSTVGYINYFISITVDFLNTLPFAAIADPQIRWLSEADTALIAVIIMAAWQWIGFNTVLFLAGLQNVPGVLYEAATVDGASPVGQFINITLPLLAPTIFFVLVTTTIQAMQVFEQVFILIPGQNPAGPNNSTLTMVLYLYQKGFQRFEQGYASAIAWVLFFLIFGATLFQFRRQRAGVSYDL